MTVECAVLAWTAASAAEISAAAGIRRQPICQKQLGLAGALAAGIFAAQTVNFPILPFCSGHLVGGTLAAWVLGPSLGSLTMATVLTIQALLLGDGGIVTLGANMLNMAFVPAAIVWAQRRWVSRASVSVAAVASLVAAAGLIVVQVTAFPGQSEAARPLSFAREMLLIHAWLAIPEVILTILAVRLLGGIMAPGQLRPDSLRIAGCWGVALTLILCLLPISTPIPDGYESAAVHNGYADRLSENAQEILSREPRIAPLVRFNESTVTAAGALLPHPQLLLLATTLLASAAVRQIASTISRPFRPGSVC